jgi:diguanylate cyclase (GGDEF)-like protein
MPSRRPALPTGRRLAAVAMLCLAAAARAEPPLPPRDESEAAALRALAQQAALLEQAGQRTEALRLLRELARRSDALQRAERERLAAALRERHAGERQRQQLERLRLDAERREAERAIQAAARRLTVAVGIAALLACAVLAQWLWLSRRRLQALRRDRAELQERSARDALTGLCNRGHAEQRLDGLQADPPPGGAVLLLLDVDHFKRINDTHGHAAGDAVLQQLAARLRGLGRDTDLVARWGGEEFLVLLRPAPGDGGAAFATRLLACVADRPFDIGTGQALAVTVSAGVVPWPRRPGERWPQALEAADAALYRAKAAGRNRAERAEEAPA